MRCRNGKKSILITFLLFPSQHVTSEIYFFSGVGAIIHEINIDCSDFAFDLGKTLITNLYSKDDSARTEAVESLREIAIKCTDTKAIEALVKQVFAVLNGCDGKITVAEFRINILQVSVLTSERRISEYF